MNEETENPAAFPRLGEGYGSAKYETPGMTLRDWFAGQALAGFAASPAAMKGAWQDGRVAACAYEIADAMLKERKQ